MIVSCDAECIHNDDGQCNNVTPIGQERVTLVEDWMGHLVCKDYEKSEEENV